MRLRIGHHNNCYYTNKKALYICGTAPTVKQTTDELPQRCGVRDDLKTDPDLADEKKGSKLDTASTKDQKSLNL